MKSYLSTNDKFNDVFCVTVSGWFKKSALFSVWSQFFIIFFEKKLSNISKAIEIISFKSDLNWNIFSDLPIIVAVNMFYPGISLTNNYCNT